MYHNFIPAAMIYMFILVSFFSFFVLISTNSKYWTAHTHTQIKDGNQGRVFFRRRFVVTACYFLTPSHLLYPLVSGFFFFFFKTWKNIIRGGERLPNCPAIVDRVTTVVVVKIERKMPSGWVPTGHGQSNASAQQLAYIEDVKNLKIKPSGCLRIAKPSRRSFVFRQFQLARGVTWAGDLRLSLHDLLTACLKWCARSRAKKK